MKSELPPLTTHEETVGRNHPDPVALERYKRHWSRLSGEPANKGANVEPLPERTDDEGTRHDGQELAFGPPATTEAKKAMKRGLAACRAALDEALNRNNEQ